MKNNEHNYRQRLHTIVSESATFMQQLRAVRSLQLPHWCIGAGAIRNLVWDYLGQYSTPTEVNDVDVAYYDCVQLSSQRDYQLQAILQKLMPHVPWEVTNQAAVHHWFESHFGHSVEPLHSLEEAVATWPEYATSVGVCLGRDDELEIIAPHGLADLFNRVVRRNPVRVSVETYKLRIQEKNYCANWASVTVIDP